MMLPLLAGVNAAVGELRDAAVDTAQKAAGGDPNKRRQQSGSERALKVASRSGFLGNLDPYVNLVSGVRYGTDVTTKLAGPVFGGAASAIQTGIEAATRNSANTNTTERKAAKQAYDVLIEPAINLMLGALPGSSIPAAILTQFAGSGAPREAFAGAVAGPPQPKGQGGGNRASRGTGRGSR
jgi:hypothetical protein